MTILKIGTAPESPDIGKVHVVDAKVPEAGTAQNPNQFTFS